MTATQQARVAGFNASLTKRGVTLKLDGTEITFDALINSVGDQLIDFEVGQDQREFAEVHILKETPELDKVSYGSLLIDYDSKVRYRVTRLQSVRPAAVTVIFYCHATNE